jgi:hypothetical protein
MSKSQELTDDIKLVPGASIYFYFQDGSKYSGILTEFDARNSHWILNTEDCIRFSPESYTSKKMLPLVLLNGYYEPVKIIGTVKVILPAD